MDPDGNVIKSGERNEVQQRMHSNLIQEMNSAQAVRQFATARWYETYYHSDFLGDLFRDPVFKQWYQGAVQRIFTQAAGEFPNLLDDMMHTVMFYQMNSELPALVDSLNGGHGIDETDADEYWGYINTVKPMVEFCYQQDITEAGANPRRVINVTSRNWKTEVLTRYQVTARGYTYELAGVGRPQYYSLYWNKGEYYTNFVPPQPAAPPAA